MSSAQKIPTSKSQSNRSRSSKNIPEKKTPSQTEQSYRQQIIRLFGEIYQFQFGRILAGGKLEFKKREQFIQNIQVFIKQLEEGFQYQTKQSYVKLEKEKLKNLIFDITLKKQIAGDLDFVVENSGKCYQEFHSQIWKHLQNQKNSKNHQIWLIENYLGVEEEQFKNEKVMLFFQVKRNLFTKDSYQKKEEQKSENIKKQQQSMNALQTSRKNQEQDLYVSEDINLIVQEKIVEQRNEKQKSQNKSINSELEENSKRIQLIDLIEKQEKQELKDLIEDLKNTKILKNVKQLIKVSLAAKLYKKNLLQKKQKLSAGNRFSFYLVVNQYLSKEDFKRKFKYFKNYLKLWFGQLGGILHIIGFNPKGQRQEQVQQNQKKMEDRIKNLEQRIKNQEIAEQIRYEKAEEQKLEMKNQYEELLRMFSEFKKQSKFPINKVHVEINKVHGEINKVHVEVQTQTQTQNQTK